MLLSQHVQMINFIKALKETTAAVNEKPNLSKFLQLISMALHNFFFFFLFGVGEKDKGRRWVFVFNGLPSEKEVVLELVCE